MKNQTPILFIGAILFFAALLFWIGNYYLVNNQRGAEFISGVPTNKRSSASSVSDLTETIIEEGSPALCRVDGHSVESRHTGFSGDGYINVDDTMGASIVWSINAPASAEYDLLFHFASEGSTTRPGRLFVNSGSSDSAVIDFSTTGTWSSWADTSVRVKLNQGKNTLALVATSHSGLANIDYLSFTGAGEITAESCEGLASASNSFSVASHLFDSTQKNTLGLSYPSGVQHSIAYSAQAGLSQYNHGAVLFPFKNTLYLQWQSSRADEDAADTLIRFSTSSDGLSWSVTKILLPARAGAVVTSGGWWSDGKTLVAFINVWPKGLSPRGGFTEYMTSQDGVHWSQPAALTMADGQVFNGVIEQDIKPLPGGRLLTAMHQQSGLILRPVYTDDPLGISGWQVGHLPHLDYKGHVSRELEPSWFLKADGSIQMVFRDQGSSYHVLTANSVDYGVNWTQAVETNLPESRAKQSAGNLSNGMAFLVNNPSGNRTRLPLTLMLSPYGMTFDRAWLLAGGENLPAMRYKGLYKREGYSYPKSIVWQDFLFVSYAINKEDIAVTRVPISSLIASEKRKN